MIIPNINGLLLRKLKDINVNVNFTYLAALLSLFLGLILGIVLQKYYRIGSMFRILGRRMRALTKPFNAYNPILRQPDEVLDEVKLRIAQARYASRINRNEYGRVVHIYGDSIARGWGFGIFEDKNPLNRIQDIAQIILQDNGINEHELFFRYAWTQEVKRISQELKSGLIKDGDVIVFEEAGPHEDNIVQYRKKLLAIKDAVESGGQKINLVLTTMFDYWPAPHYYNSEYDALIGDSNLTMNQVVLEVAKNEYLSVLDWNKLMDRAVEELRLFGISPMHRDGVHPNIYGNFLLAISLLNHIGFSISNYNSIKQEFKKLPPSFYTQLQWAKPLAEARIEQVLQILLKIGTTG